MNQITVSRLMDEQAMPSPLYRFSIEMYLIGNIGGCNTSN